jgi:hypothetical protein
LKNIKDILLLSRLNIKQGRIFVSTMRKDVNTGVEGRLFSTVFVSPCWRAEISPSAYWDSLRVSTHFLTAGRNTIESDLNSSYGTSMLIAG